MFQKLSDKIWLWQIRREYRVTVNDYGQVFIQQNNQGAWVDLAECTKMEACLAISNHVRLRYLHHKESRRKKITVGV